MHKNSLEAYKEGTKGTFKSRSQKIFECLWYGHKELTDREILHSLYPGSDNKNLISPRCTEMLKEGVLEEVGERMEGVFRVRVVGVKMPVKEGQQEVLF